MGSIRVSRSLWFSIGAAGIVVVGFVGFLMVETLRLGQFPQVDAGNSALWWSLAGAGTLVAYGAWYVSRRMWTRSVLDSQEFLFLDALPVAVFVLDRDGHPAYANILAKQMLGKGIVPQTPPQKLSSVYPSFFARTMQAYPTENMPIVRALEGERSIVDNVEIERNGKRIPIEARAAPVRDPDGRIVGSIAVFHDITDRRSAERERTKRIQKEAELRQAQAFEELRSAFINQAAHELFTPLTPMKIDLELVADLVRAKGTDDDRQSLSRMQTGVNRLQFLADKILSLAQIEADQFYVEREPLRLDRLVLEELDFIRRAVESKRIKLQVDIAEEVTMVGDAERLRPAIKSVLDNAVKFTPPQGTIRIALSIRQSETHLVVEDSGPGLSAEELKHVFDPFWQTKVKARREETGLGVGLYLSQSIAAAHGGRIVAESDGRGRGARFRFELPLAGPQGPPPSAAPVPVAA